MKTFVVHYKKLTERRERLTPVLNANNLNYEFIDWYDRETLTKKQAAEFKLSSIFWFLVNKKQRASICITLSHLHCWKQTITFNYEYALILEDDVILSDNFRANLEKYLKEVPADWDMLFIGDACGFHIPDIRPGIHIYKKSPEKTSWGGQGATRAADSYLIRRKCAQKILDYIGGTKIDKQVDWWLNYVIRDCDFNVYWAEPTIASQGSQKGLYKTSWA